MFISATPKQAQAGFTLIELMIVVAIVGILAAVGIPSYLTYTNKAKFSEVVQATAPYKVAVEVCGQENTLLSSCGAPGTNGIPPNFAAGSATAGNVASIATGANGVITATSQQIGANYTYVLTPTKDATTGQITWAKSGGCVAAALC